MNSETTLPLTGDTYFCKNDRCEAEADGPDQFCATCQEAYDAATAANADLLQQAQDALGDAITALDRLYQRNLELKTGPDRVWADGGEVAVAIEHIHAAHNRLEAKNDLTVPEGPDPNDPRPGWGAYQGQFQGEAQLVW